MITKWLSMIRINGLDPLLPVTDPGGRPIIHFTLYGSHTNDLISDHLCAIEQNWFLPPKYHHSFYVRLSERTLWLWFWNYSCLYLAQSNFIEKSKKFAGFLVILTFLLWMILAILITALHICDNMWRENIHSSIYSHYKL